MIYPDKIIRSKRKTLAVCIDNLGAVIVRAPLRLSEDKIYAFLQEKEAWIRDKKAKKDAVGLALPPKCLDGYTFLLLGEPCKITLYEGKKIGFDKENGRLFLPQENAQARLLKWLKENAKRIFSTVAEQKAQEMGVHYQSVRISGAKTRWGTCSADNRLCFTFRLLYAPKRVIEYVIVHELSHVRHKNHSRRFWQEVEKYVPDWKERRKWLKERAILMEIF
ncbi:MAG: M48 family metallopeptidase [Clostridiales bacterium]|nr:M48 family metallopeptidase [Clostridiales bacterium]